MPARFSPELALVGRELTRMRADVSRADVHTLSSAAGLRDAAATVRASTYVWLASTLERVVRDALKSTFREVSSKLLPAHQLRASLFSLLCDADFESVSKSARSKAWGTKIALLSRLLDSGPATLSEDVLPLDGRTIRGDHFDVIWHVLGIDGSSVPSPRHRVALRDLADGRNEVAHGHSDPVAFGRTKATADVLKLISLTDDSIAHLLAGLDSYLSQELYRR